MLTLTTLIGGVRDVRPLSDGVWLIGRSEMCRIRFDFPDVSERHALLTVRDDKAFLEDLHSSNGTYVNGELIDSPVELRGDMIVQVGPGMLRVSGEEAVEPEPEPAAESAGQGDEDGLGGDDEPAPDPMRELRRSVQEQIQRELQIGRAHV